MPAIMAKNTKFCMAAYFSCVEIDENVLLSFGPMV